MLIEGNTLIGIDEEDVIDGVFVAPDEVLYIGDRLLCDNVVKMVLPNVIGIGDDFLLHNRSLEYLEIPKVERIGSYFLFVNKVLIKIVMPNIKEIGYRFMAYSPNFVYTIGIVKSLEGYLYIGGEIVDKGVYIRKLNLNKII